MKKCLLFIIPFLMFISCSNDSNIPNTEGILPTEKSELLRHVVLFKFKETASEDSIKKVEDAFKGLTDKIKEINDFEWGLNNSPEGLNKEFTHCFFVTFESEEDRAVYLPHPAHMEFVEVLSPHLEDVLVLDYWSK